MQRQADAFKIKVDGKILDYRQGRKLNLEDVKSFFSKNYKVKKICNGPRHVLGILEKSGREFFLKLSTTEGISAITKNEYKWNEEFNDQIKRETSRFWVPRNWDSGLYQNKLFYLITDKFDGEYLAQKPAGGEISKTFLASIPQIIDFSQLIQNLKTEYPDQKVDYQKWFVNKTRSWLKSIPNDVQSKYQVEKLLKIVEKSTPNLKTKPCHGDFTPWHLVKLKTGQLGLIDGEHAMAGGVEGYDIGYFIQRVFSVLQNPTLAKKILIELTKKNYQIEKLKIILAARAIGGFLDESLTPHPSYSYADKFQKWLISL